MVEALERALERPWRVPAGEPDQGEMKTHLDALCRSMLRQAVAGSVPAADWVANRVWGKPQQSVEVTSHQEQRVVVVPWLPAVVDPETGRPRLPGEATAEELAARDTVVVVEAGGAAAEAPDEPGPAQEHAT